MKKAGVKFQGQFPKSRSAISFRAPISSLHSANISAPMLRAFDEVMAEDYPDLAIRPRLKKITITIHF